MFVLLGVVYCSKEDGEEYQQELITKLRVIGVATDPGILSLHAAEKTVIFTLYALTPKGQTITFDSYTDPKWNKPLSSSVVNSEIIVEEKAGFDLHQIIQTHTLGEQAIEEIPEDPGYLSYNYGLQVKTADESEKVMGSLVFFHPKNAAATWTPHKIKITSLTDGQTVNKDQELALEAEIQNRNNESYRLGWFTSSGKIINRRNIKTKITNLTTGKQTIIVTARGMHTGLFAMDTIEIEVE